MYEFRIEKKLAKTLKKLAKKDNSTYEQVKKKIQEIINSENVEHYKNLKYPLQHLKRIHIKEKVLIFKFDKKNKFISFENFKHHDKIYKTKT
jgi:YafQ family addiction module toxin component|tara:strand:+ start:232 stop:507 length:276 start_codon:yes stop_codon:yes gene_type:complete